MQKLIVNGGKKLAGELNIQGAKNSVLPLMAAAVLCGGKVFLGGCPRITDCYASMRILNRLGCRASGNGTLTEIDTADIHSTSIPDELMREMRSSVIFMGALLGRTGSCTVSLPGGCDLGPRPIDIHLGALRKMGAEISEEHGRITCTAPEGLSGTKITLPFPSVGATENIILAAVLAKGDTVIKNAAREPEICDLADFINMNGGSVSGAGGGTIFISGRKKLVPTGDIFTVMPDRIACATYLSYAAALPGSEILIKRCVPAHLDAVTAVFEQMGCAVRTFGDSIYLRPPARLKSAGTVRTMVYPGFPTDAQAMVMTDTCLAEGITLFTENIFENRYRHVGELQRMGADIRTEGKVAAVMGVGRLYGAKITAPDLRGGAALVGAALAAEGESEIDNVLYIDRGYELLEENLSSLGADVRRTVGSPDGRG